MSALDSEDDENATGQEKEPLQDFTKPLPLSSDRPNRAIQAMSDATAALQKYNNEQEKRKDRDRQFAIAMKAASARSRGAADTENGGLGGAGTSGADKESGSIVHETNEDGSKSLIVDSPEVQQRLVYEQMEQQELIEKYRKRGQTIPPKARRRNRNRGLDGTNIVIRTPYKSNRYLQRNVVRTLTHEEVMERVSKVEIPPNFLRG